MTMARSLTLMLCAVGGVALLTATAQAATTKLDPRNTPAQNVRPAAPPAADGTLGVALLAALVQSDGSLLSGSGATGATRLGTGTYEVDFNRDVTGCYYTATPFNAGFSIETEPRSGNPNGVFVSIQFRDGTAADQQFYLIVYCGR